MVFILLIRRTLNYGVDPSDSFYCVIAPIDFNGNRFVSEIIIYQGNLHGVFKIIIYFFAMYLFVPLFILEISDRFFVLVFIEFWIELQFCCCWLFYSFVFNSPEFPMTQHFVNANKNANQFHKIWVESNDFGSLHGSFTSYSSLFLIYLVWFPINITLKCIDRFIISTISIFDCTHDLWCLSHGWSNE